MTQPHPTTPTHPTASGPRDAGDSRRAQVRNAVQVLGLSLYAAPCRVAEAKATLPVGGAYRFDMTARAAGVLRRTAQTMRPGVLRLNTHDALAHTLAQLDVDPVAFEAALRETARVVVQGKLPEAQGPAARYTAAMAAVEGEFKPLTPDEQVAGTVTVEQAEPLRFTDVQVRPV